MALTSGEGALGAEVALGKEHTGLLCGEGTHVGMGPGSGYSSCFLRQAPKLFGGVSTEDCRGHSVQGATAQWEREKGRSVHLFHSDYISFFSLAHILFFNMLVWTGHPQFPEH